MARGKKGLKLLPYSNENYPDYGIQWLNPNQEWIAEQFAQACTGKSFKNEAERKRCFAFYLSGFHDALKLAIKLRLQGK